MELDGFGGIFDLAPIAYLFARAFVTALHYEIS
jgi:hypothetical protein